MKGSLHARVLSAGAWTAGGFAVQKAFQLGSNLILTRLLFPEAFGLMALANVVLIALGMFSDVGIKPAIVQSERGEDPVFLNTAWTIQVMRGFMLWGGACLFAYPASLIYRNATLWPLLSALGATAAINGFASISLATSERRLQIRRLTVVQLCGQVVTLVLTAFMAWQLRSVWALAIGGITGAVVATVFSHLFLPGHKHAFCFDKPSAQALVRFGRWIFISTAFVFTAGHGLRMLQGVLLTTTELGVLSIAQTIAAMPTELIAQVVAMAIFPALSEARHSGHARMIDVLGKVHGKLLGGAVVTFALTGLLAIPVIQLLYDQRYAAAGPQLALLCLGGAIAAMSSPYQNTAMAMGHTRLSATINGLNTVLRAAGVWLGYKVGGTTGMLLGVAFGSLIGHLYVMSCAHRLGILRIRTDCLALLGIALSTIMTLAVYSPERLFAG